MKYLIFLMLFFFPLWAYHIIRFYLINRKDKKYKYTWEGYLSNRVDFGINYIVFLYGPALIVAIVLLFVYCGGVLVERFFNF